MTTSLISRLFRSALIQPRLLKATLAACLLSFSGCGGESDGTVLAPVKGVLTLDGKPMGGATIVFTPKGNGPMSMAVSGEDGAYEMRTTYNKSGVCVGEHNVTVTLSAGPPPQKATDDGLAPLMANEAAGGGAKRPAAPRTVWLIPERYSKPDTSGLGVTVTSAGLPSHDLALKK